MRIDQLDAVDYFCGAGGASRGLHDAGYQVVGFDHWPVAIATHNANGLLAFTRDLSEPTQDGTWARLPRARLAWFSPPCQPFSAAGDGDGEVDERDGFPWTVRILADTLPDVAIIENVKGITFEKHSHYLGGILSMIRALGYRVDWNVLNCADYGVPQTRERCIIIARRDDGPIVWPTVTHTELAGMFTEKWVSMAEALGWGDTPLVGRYRRGAGMSERHGERPTVHPVHPAPTVHPVHPAPTVHRNTAKDLLWLLDRRASEDAGVLLVDPALDPAPCVTTVPAQWQWVQAGRDDNATRRTVDQPAPTVLARKDAGAWTVHRPATTIAGDVRVSAPGRHDPTVSGSQQADAIRLTIPELARLQDFPDDWQWCGTKTDQARQIGNAVPRTLARILAAANRPVTT